MFNLGKKSALGIDIGSKFVKVVELNQAIGKPELTSIAIAPLQKGTIVDGLVNNRDALLQVMRDLFRTIKTNLKHVAISLSNSEVVVKRIMVPEMSDTELDEHIIWEAEQYLPAHILSDVQDTADRIAIIDRGHILTIGRTDELTTDLVSSHMYEIEFFDEFENHSLLKSFDQIQHIEQPTSKKIRIHINKNSDLKSLTNEIIKRLLHSNHHIKNFFRTTPNLDDVYLKCIKERKSQ